jgi:hypothetical protein
MPPKKKRLTQAEIDDHKNRVIEDRIRLDSMRGERGGMKDKLKADFLSNLSTHFTENELEAIEVAPASEAIPLVFDKIDGYITEQLDIRDAEIAEFEKEVDGNHSSLEQMSEIASFFADNPDLDEEAFDDFIENFLSNGKIKELAELPIKERFEKVKLLFDDANGSGKKKDVELPIYTDSMVGATGNITQQDNDVTENSSFLEQAGIYR